MRALWSDRQIALITCLKILNISGASLTILDKNRAPTGPEMLSSAGAGVWKAPQAFLDSNSVLDKFPKNLFVLKALSRCGNRSVLLPR